MSHYKASVLSQLSTDQVVMMWSNMEFKRWITDINASTMSQDQLKEEAWKFSPILGNLNKKTIMKRVEDFVKAEKKELSEVSMMIFKEMGGTEGKKRGRFDIPPRTYCPKNFKDFKMTKLDPQNESKMKCEMCDINMSKKEEIMTHIQTNHEDILKRVFSKEVMSLTLNHKEYCEWLSQDLCVEIGDSNDYIAKDAKDVKADQNVVTLTRNLPSGPNIFETQTTKLKVQKDGTTKKTVITGQVANITTRKRESDNNTDDATGVKRKLGEAERRQAKNISNILDHVSGNDQDTQASLISKVIDQKGPGFAEKVTIKSKELKEKKKYSAKETAAIITGAGMPDNVMTKLRTVSNKTFGYCPYASHKKVVAARENILPFSR